MDETTTSDSGAITAQPQIDEAGSNEAIEGNEQVISTDENGTPSLQPLSSQAPTQSADEAVSETESKDSTETKETQAEYAADKTDDEILAWSEKKGIKLNPDNPNEVNLARMQLEAERKMHQANQRPAVTPPEEIPITGDPNIDQVVERQNQTELRMYVRDWFEANPDMKDHRTELQEIAQQRPWLTDMDDIKAHFLADPSRTDKLKAEGGKQALQNLAQKQQAIPPEAAATNSAVFESQNITPQNVFELVDKNDQKWYEKNYEAINKAISGK